MTTPETVLCWIFQRDRHVLTCELDIRVDGSYDVTVVPHWNAGLSAVEHFDALSDAVLRHAEIARELRESGWSVTEHVQPNHAPLAA